MAPPERMGSAWAKRAALGRAYLFMGVARGWRRRMSRAAFSRMTGAELRVKRKTAGLSQAQLAEAAGIGRQAVSYWERKPILNNSSWACQRMFEVLGICIMSHKETLTRARGDGVLLVRPAMEQEEAGQARAWKETREAQRHARLQVPCCAMTRKGQPCRMQSEPGRKRCKFHGGRSTGPRTLEGRARIAEAQRRRWVAYRTEKQAHTHNEQSECPALHTETTSGISPR